jgi:hypothetical protein
VTPAATRVISSDGSVRYVGSRTPLALNKGEKVWICTNPGTAETPVVFERVERPAEVMGPGPPRTSNRLERRAMAARKRRKK